ncbi:MAG: hypothetical protein JWO80_1622 [Bryobacterales bacterium]|nr:hypothetical protein [Bryobacterales bacterium]
MFPRLYRMVNCTLLSQSKLRIGSVDALRGLVMIIMALDHVRDFFHAGAMSFQPDDLTRTTPALFFTRWITHFCAPVFMFTAGLAAFFWLSRGRTTGQLSAFLWKRGLWLAFLELTAVHFAMFFNFTSGLLLITVLWGLGWSMVVLAMLVYLPVSVLAVVSIAVIALHNLADPLAASRFGSFAWVWNFVHQVGVFRAGPVSVVISYPLVPWVAVMTAGFCFGQIFVLDPPLRRKWMIRIGLGLTIAFFVIRGVNVYGDPVRWSNQLPGMTVLSFLRCTKYPPSLDFLLMTLGPAILLLAWFDRVRFTAANPLIVFGRVPLFYFIVHLYVIHLLAIPLAWLRYGNAAFLLNPLPSMGGSRELYPTNYGYELWVVYVLWIAIVGLLYPLCLWYARFKERAGYWWLSYL